MITYQILPGTVDVSATIRIIDSTDGTPETGVVFNTSGIDLEYRREGAASTDITEATLAALTTAHADGGFLHIGNGYYRLDLPDAACASGVPGVLVHGTVTGMVVIGCYIQLEGHVNSTYARIGAPAGASVSADVAAVKVDTAAILVDTGTTLDARIPAALVSGRIDASVGAMAANVLTATAINADAITAAKVAADVSAEIADAVWDEDATGHQTTGTFGQAIGDPVADTNTIYKAVVTDATGATVGVDVVAVKVDTAAILVDTGTTLDARIPAALVSGRIDASVGAMAANVMTAAAAAADLTTELQTGLATAAALTTVDDFLDTEVAAILAAVDTEIGTLTTNLATVDGIVDDIKQMIGHKTTIATLASQTSFTLTAGSADNDAYNGWGCFVIDASTATQIALGVVSDYTGSTKTITLLTDPAVFTMATTDIVILLPAKITDGVALTAAGVDAILDEIVEGSVTLRQSVRLWNSAMGAKASGLATTTAVYRDLGDTKNRITGTVDVSGNRSAVTLDLT